MAELSRGIRWRQLTAFALAVLCAALPALIDSSLAILGLMSSTVAYLLWGAHAQAKAPLIERTAPGRHRLLCANHPSPLSARRPPQPFIGCGHFAALRAEGVDLGPGAGGEAGPGARRDA